MLICDENFEPDLEISYHMKYEFAIQFYLKTHWWVIIMIVLVFNWWKTLVLNAALIKIGESPYI